MFSEGSPKELSQLGCIQSGKEKPTECVSDRRDSMQGIGCTVSGGLKELKGGAA
jgi:hypothetical protein